MSKDAGGLRAAEPPLPLQRAAREPPKPKPPETARPRRSLDRRAAEAIKRFRPAAVADASDDDSTDFDESEAITVE